MTTTYLENLILSDDKTVSENHSIAHIQKFLYMTCDAISEGLVNDPKYNDELAAMYILLVKLSKVNGHSLETLVQQYITRTLDRE